MMLAEAGICGNRGVADGGPFVGLGLFFSASVYVRRGGGVYGVVGRLSTGPPFFRQISLDGQIIEGDLDSCGITAYSEKACQ